MPDNPQQKAANFKMMIMDQSDQQVDMFEQESQNNAYDSSFNNY